MEILRDTLRDEEVGTEKVVRAQKHVVTKHPQSANFAQELGCFRKHKERMR